MLQAMPCKVAGYLSKTRLTDNCKSAIPLYSKCNAAKAMQLRIAVCAVIPAGSGQHAQLDFHPVDIACAAEACLWLSFKALSGMQHGSQHSSSIWTVLLLNHVHTSCMPAPPSPFTLSPSSSHSEQGIFACMVGVSTPSSHSQTHNNHACRMFL